MIIGFSKTNNDRLETVRDWHDHYTNIREPSALIIGYELFTRLVVSDDDRNIASETKRRGPAPKPKKAKQLSASEKQLEKLKPDFRRYLQGGIRTFLYRRKFSCVCSCKR